VRAPLFDGFFMLSGLWLAPFALYIGSTTDTPYEGPIDNVYLMLTALFWIGHRLSSAYLAYCTTAYRPLLTTQRKRFVWVPIAIATSVFVFLVPEGFGPWTRAQRLMGLVILDFGLITYHFASQHYGVLSLYRVRAGQPRTRAAKIADRVFALSVGGALVFIFDAMSGNDFHQDVWLHGWLSPDWLDNAWGPMTHIGFWFIVVATVAMLVMEWKTGQASLPRVLYLLSVSLVVACAFLVHPFVFIVLWTVQHWTAAMGLATVVARGDPDPGSSRWYRFWHVVNKRPWVLLLVLMAGSTLLLPVMEVEAAPSASYAERFVPALMDFLKSSDLAPALIAVGFVTAFLHYQLDRAVFRFSNPEVRQAAGAALLE
jgi:hypothetical protein